jgi:EAL domain-containing protein (putative c-di-GMP-specific phosphodiesterase class I)
LAAWRKTELKLPRISVNLFAAQFHAPSLKGNVMRTLAHHGLEPQDIELEITEKITLNFDRASIGPLYDLVACGVGVALDDFGTGFASLATLTRAPITQLKIDRRFVENIADDPHNRAVVAGMVAISDTLDVGLIAEGVETLEQAEQLQAMGCQIVQGFLFGKPMSAKDFEKFYFDRVACAAVA